MNKLFAVILSLSLIISPLGSVAYAGATAAQNKNQLTTIATSIVGVNIMLYCNMAWKQPSLAIYMAGSTIHFMAEILAGKSIKNAQERSDKELKELERKVQNGELQLAALEEYSRSHQDKSDFVSKRINWLKKVKIIYHIAAASAIAEAIAALGGIVPTDQALCGNPAGLIASEGLITTYKIAYAAQLLRAGQAEAAIGALLYAMILWWASPAMILTMFEKAGFRILTFEAAALLVDDVEKELEGVKEKIDGEKGKIDQLINKFKADNSDPGGLELGDGPGQGKDVKSEFDMQFDLDPLAPGVQAPRECMAKDGSVNGTDACKTAMKINRPTFSPNMQMPTLIGAANTATDMANQMAAGDMAGASVSAAALGSQAGRIKDIKDDLLKKYKDQLKAKGKNYDHDAEVKKVMASMSNNFDQAVAKASAGGGMPAAGTAAVGADLKKESTGSAEAITAPAAPTGEGITDTALTETPPTDPSDLTETAPTPTLSASLEQYETNENDISKTPEVSIFKQLSNRYILNYTKIFKREEPVPEPVEETKK